MNLRRVPGLCPLLGLCGIGLGLCLILFGCDGQGQSQPQTSTELLLATANQVLIQALTDRDPRARAFGTEVIASTGQLRFLGRVRMLARDPVVPVRFSALAAIGDLRYSPAKPDVQQIFNETSEDRNCRMAAAYALYRLGSASHARYYWDAISDQDLTVRANAALLLGKSGDPAALQVLHKALENNTDQGVLVQVAESIAMLRDASIYPRLWSRLISAYADDRIAGIRAMGLLGTDQARQAIMTMLDDSVMEVRLAAAEQLGRLNDTSGEAKVAEAIKFNQQGKAESTAEASGKVRLEVHLAQAIGEIGTPQLISHLQSLLNSESQFVRLAAAKAVLTAMGRHAGQ